MSEAHVENESSKGRPSLSCYRMTWRPMRIGFLAHIVLCVALPSCGHKDTARPSETTAVRLLFRRDDGRILCVREEADSPKILVSFPVYDRSAQATVDWGSFESFVAHCYWSEEEKEDFRKSRLLLDFDTISGRDLAARYLWRILDICRAKTIRLKACRSTYRTGSRSCNP